MRILLYGLIVMTSCAMLAVAPEHYAVAADLSLGAAINKAGRQRMLTQRIVKAYAQIQLGVSPHAARTQLADAVALFEAQLADLRKSSTDREVHEVLARLERLWTPFRALAVKPVTQDGLRGLMAQDEAILSAAHKLVLVLQDRSGTPVGRLVNISGRQRMLSQRLAKFYMLRLAGLETAGMREDVEAARNEFSGALAELAAAPENSDAIVRELRAVALQWEWFHNALTLEGARSYALIVADSSESILNAMDLVTAMYEGLSPR